MSHFRITQVEVCTGLDHFVHSNLKFKAALRKQQTSSELLLKLSPSPALIQKIFYILCSCKKHPLIGAYQQTRQTCHIIL